MDLATLRPLYDRPGPWASVYLDASYDIEDARQLMDLRWRGLDRELAAAGADEATRSAIANGIDVTTVPPGRCGLAILAAAGSVALRRSLPDPPAPQAATWSWLPRVAPLLEAVPARVRWVRVTVDRTGADVELDSGTFQVEGSETYPIHKSGQGGWSAPRYERATEVTWDRNARDVAGAVTRAVDTVGADVVILAGDVRARQLLQEHLPKRVAARAVEAAGSRAPGSAAGSIEQATRTAVREHAEQARQALLERFEIQAGHGQAVDGLAHVIAAARAGALDVLLLNPYEARAPVWLDPADPTTIAADEPTLRQVNPSGAISLPAAEVLLAAAARTDTEVAIVHSEIPLADGVGAVIRFRG